MSPAPNPLPTAAGTVVFRRACGAGGGVRVLMKGAVARAGVSPLGRRRPVAQYLLGVGLFEIAAQSGW